MKVTTYGLLPAFALAALFCPATQAAEPEKYHVHTFAPPPGFETLDAFIQANYEDSLDITTLTSTTIEGQSAMTFWTDAGGIREFNLLIQGSEDWILMTSANLAVTQDDPSLPATNISINTSRMETRTKSPHAMSTMSTVIASNVFSSPCMTPTNGGNCTLFVRCLAPWLAKIDLTSYAAKKSLITSGAGPAIGAVAVIPVTGSYQFNGHLAYVIAVNRDSKGQITTISIVESNFAYQPGFDVRTDTPANLHIAGYVLH